MFRAGIRNRGGTSSPDLKVITRNPAAREQLELGAIGRGCVGVLFLDGRYAETLDPGPWAIWKGAADVRVVEVDLRETTLDIQGQELMNKVTEARKAAEANLIIRREETAALRSQANTAKLLAENPTLMRLRELEVLEKIVASGKLSVFLGEKGLADRVMNLI